MKYIFADRLGHYFFYKNHALNGKRLKARIISNELAKIYEVVQNYAIQNMLEIEDQQSKKI